MILNDVALFEWAETKVKPFNFEHINPASMDLTMGSEYISLNDGLSHYSIDEPIIILPGNPILATTVEYINMPEDCAGTLYLKSSLARLGLDHALAGWIDPGFNGQITLELHAHPKDGITIHPGQRICQIVLSRMEHIPFRSYRLTGRYNNQIGPTKAR